MNLVIEEFHLTEALVYLLEEDIDLELNGNNHQTCQMKIKEGIS